jgi:hypothetical protein
MESNAEVRVIAKTAVGRCSTRVVNRTFWSFTAFAISLLALSPIAFYFKSPLVFYRYDGTFILILARMQEIWASSLLAFVSNPLQGIGGLALPQHALLDPGLWLTAHLSPVTGPVAAMTFYAASLAVAICWVGMRLGLAAPSAISAAWLGLLIALPYVYPAPGFDFLWGAANFMLLILFQTIAILLFLDLGRGPRTADLGRFLGIACLYGYQLHEMPHFVPVTAIVVAFFGGVGLIAAETPRERLIKAGAGLALAGLALVCFGRVIYGLYGFAKPTFFWYEFAPVRIGLRDQSFLITREAKWPAWLVYGLAILGALHAVLWGNRVMRAFGSGLLMFVLIGFALIWFIGETWKGPRPAYVDIFAYPFYCVFAAHAVAVAVNQLSAHLAWRHLQTTGALAISGLPWLVLVDATPPPLERPLVRNLNPFIWPPAETPISKFLAADLALQPGSAFRGRVANIAGSDFDPQWVTAPFVNQHNYDGMSLFFSGNDHRMYGLWYLDIPTLFEVNQFSSPFFHVVNARLLNAPGSLDTRSYETQSIPNDRVMALLGVRYLMSDKRLPDRTPVLEHRLVEGRDLFVYSVPNTNAAGYPVTQTRRANSAQEAVALLADPAMDLRSVAVLTDGDEVPALVKTDRSSLLVEHGGYRIEATSPGTSLLVLPIEYSHCLRPEWTSVTGAQPPRLLRANLTMAAILFAGEVKGRLVLRYGPLSSGCRIEDWREAEALRLGDAREWPTAH